MPRAIAILCFALSGFAGLVYETCWIRQASLVFGSTTLAFSTVLATFFAGLALGSWWFGRAAQRTWRPLRLYAVLEIALAALALLSPWAFALSDQVYGWIYRTWTDDPLLLAGTRMAVVAVLLLPPTVLMGGTFPLFCRQFVVARETIAGSVGSLYAINTLGAAAGCAATGFALLPAVGVHGSIAIAAVLNTIAGAAALFLRLTAPVAATAPDVARQQARQPRARLVGALFFAIGLVALGSQVLWARFLALLVPNTVHTYTITLTVVLLGIVLGSWVASRLFDGRLPRVPSFGALLVLTGLSLLALMHLPPPWWRGMGGELGICALLMLGPAVLSGASFPLAIRMVLDEPGAAGVMVGRMTALNTLGGIAGALAVGCLALPLLGTQRTLLALSGISVAAGATAWLGLSSRARLRSRRTAAVVAAVALWLALPTVLGSEVPRDFLATPHRLLAWCEGSGASLAVVRSDGVRRLEIDRWWQGEDRVTHQIMAAHLPMLHARGEVDDVLVIGFGTGQAPSRFAMYDEVRRVECVDIEPAIFDFVAQYFDSAWTRDERVHLIHEDGRSYLEHGARTYDLISIEIGQLFRPGVAGFYSEEFYRRTKASLRPGGLLAQFVPLPFLEPEAFRRLVRTFVEVFPQSALWYNTAELLIVGVADGPIGITPERLALIESDERVQRDLRYSQWGGERYWLRRPGRLLGSYLCGPAGLAALSTGAEPYTDDVPALEYATSDYDPGARHELPALELLRRHLDPVEELVQGELDAQVLAEASAMREKNLADLEARAHLRLGKLLRGRGKLEGDRLLELAVRTQPDDLACLRALADTHEAEGRLDDARQLYQRVLAAHGDDALALRGLGLVLLKTGDAEGAVRELRRAVELRSEDAISQNYLGAALARTGRLKDALPYLHRALELWPGYPSAQLHLDKVTAALRGE